MVDVDQALEAGPLDLLGRHAADAAVRAVVSEARRPSRLLALVGADRDGLGSALGVGHAGGQVVGVDGRGDEGLDSVGGRPLVSDRSAVVSQTHQYVARELQDGISGLDAQRGS